MNEINRSLCGYEGKEISNNERHNAAMQKKKKKSQPDVLKLDLAL